ncbi:MAG: exodeoxyribonuclease VII large subunit [Halioglobus sp.]|nr:exodeoxyribonuclease VII large subunit [Halioglobus sp.]
MNTPFAPENPPPALTVSQLNRQAKTLLEGHFNFVWVEGEISNFAAPSSGHWYFSLKDGNAQVRCAMFRNRNQRIKLTPGNGDAIRLRCRVSLYEGRGEFQLIVEHLEHAGSGALQAAFERLKAKLLAEGLFDPSRKQPLPGAVSHLGVVTSPSGAAIHDIITVLQRRCPSIAVSLLPVAVQGEAATGEIASAIERANRWRKEGHIQLDALIVGRGGGSLEDLQAFNQEMVARAIDASLIPVVSAVGHEVDFTIADMVADFRAATPSAAAELLSPDQDELQQRLRQVKSTLSRLIRRKLQESEVSLTHLRQRLKHPGAQLREQAQRLDDLEERLLRAQKNVLQRYRSKTDFLETQLHAQSPAPQLRQLQRDIDRWRQRLKAAVQERVLQSGNRLAHLAQMLDSLSPLGTLQRGYAIVTDGTGKVLRDANDVSIGDKIDAQLANGRLALTVKAIEKVK